MYKIINDSGDIYTQYTYLKEDEFEKMIVDHSSSIFGSAIVTELLPIRTFPSVLAM